MILSTSLTVSWWRCLGTLLEKCVTEGSLLLPASSPDAMADACSLTFLLRWTLIPLGP